MSKFEITKADAVEIRSQCAKLATDIVCIYPSSGKAQIEAFKDLAKEIEKFVWGMHAPIEDAPTPLNTIEECIEATKNKITEYRDNSVLPEQNYMDLGEALNLLERLSSIVNTALVSSL